MVSSHICFVRPSLIFAPRPAGGYDAIWLLVLQPRDTALSSSVISNVEKLWNSWTGMSVSPLLATESLERGARKESLQDVPGLEAYGNTVTGEDGLVGP